MNTKMKNYVKNVVALGLITCASIFSFNASASFLGTTIQMDSVSAGATVNSITLDVPGLGLNFSGRAVDSTGVTTWSGPGLVVDVSSVLLDFSALVTNFGGTVFNDITFPGAVGDDNGILFSIAGRSGGGAIPGIIGVTSTWPNTTYSGRGFVGTTGIDANGDGVIDYQPDVFLRNGGIFFNTAGKTFLTDPNLQSSFLVNVQFSSPVPVPAAVWLFGSGLIGLVGVARRKKIS